MTTPAEKVQILNAIVKTYPALEKWKVVQSPSYISDTFNFHCVTSHSRKRFYYECEYFENTDIEVIKTDLHARCKDAVETIPLAVEVGELVRLSRQIERPAGKSKKLKVTKLGTDTTLESTVTESDPVVTEEKTSRVGPCRIEQSDVLKAAIAGQTFDTIWKTVKTLSESRVKTLIKDVEKGTIAKWFKDSNPELFA